MLSLTVIYEQCTKRMNENITNQTLGPNETMPTKYENCSEFAAISATDGSLISGPPVCAKARNAL